MNFETKIIKIDGKNHETFLQNLITNDIKLLKNNQALYSAMLTPQGKFLFDFIAIEDKESIYLEVNNNNVEETIQIIKNYDIRKNFEIKHLPEIKTSVIIYQNLPLDIKRELEKNKIIRNQDFFLLSDPRKNGYLARLWHLTNNEGNFLKKLELNTSLEIFNLERIRNTIPDSSIDLEKDKSFILNYNFDSLHAVSFQKGCYIGQENTSRIKLRNKLRRRILPVQKIAGEILENDIIKYKDAEIGKIMISDPYCFGLIKVLDPDIKEFANVDLNCGNSKVKIIKPEWI